MPKYENWAILTPNSFATVRRTEKLTERRKLPGPWTTTWSKQLSLQCITWPVACSEWGACFTDFRFQWKFSKMSFQIPRRDTKLGFMTKFGENRPLRSCRKVVWITTQKKLGLCGTRPSTHFAQNGPIVPKIFPCSSRFRPGGPKWIFNR